jgi:hypothetical protein
MFINIQKFPGKFPHSETQNAKKVADDSMLYTKCPLFTFLFLFFFKSRSTVCQIPHNLNEDNNVYTKVQ